MNKEENLIYHRVGLGRVIRQNAYCRGLPDKTNVDFTIANITVCPTVKDHSALRKQSNETPRRRVILVEAAPFGLADGGQSLATIYQPTDINVTTRRTEGVNNAALRQEWRTKEERLQSGDKELETSIEDLKSSFKERLFTFGLRP